MGTNSPGEREREGGGEGEREGEERVGEGERGKSIEGMEWEREREIWTNGYHCYTCVYILYVTYVACCLKVVHA